MGVLDDDAISFTINSPQRPDIQWLIGQDYLLVGATTGIFRAGASSVQEPITPSNISVRIQSNAGLWQCPSGDGE